MRREQKRRSKKERSKPKNTAKHLNMPANLYALNNPREEKEGRRKN